MAYSRQARSRTETERVSSVVLRMCRDSIVRALRLLTGVESDDHLGLETRGRTRKQSRVACPQLHLMPTAASSRSASSLPAVNLPPALSSATYTKRD